MQNFDLTIDKLARQLRMLETLQRDQREIQIELCQVRRDITQPELLKYIDDTIDLLHSSWANSQRLRENTLEVMQLYVEHLKNT